MRNGIQYILILCLLCGIVGCQEDILQSPAKGKGRLVLKDVEISVEASAEAITRTTSTYEAPTRDQLTYKVTNTQTGVVVYEQSGELTSLVLDEGFYKLEARYGEETMGTTPYLYTSTEEFQIIMATEIEKSISVKLSCAIVHPAIADKLLEQYKSYKIEISDGTSTQEITNNADYFVPSGKDYILTLSGTNAINEEKSNSWNLKEVVVANRYTLNCNPNLPSFTLPEQVEGNVWSTFMYITPMTAENINSEAEMKQKVLNNIIYEASSDGVNWVEATNDNGKIVIKGLTPSSKNESGQEIASKYTIRARFGNVISSNQQEVTMEGAEQLENGDMESWSSTQIYSGSGAISAAINCNKPNGNWNTRNEKTTDGAGNANGNIINSKANYAVNWKWCSGTIPTTENSNKIAEISTLALYNERVYGIWDRSEVLSYTQDNGTVYPGYLFTGHFDKSNDTYELGILHTSRPLSISFNYSYQPVTGDQCIAYAKLYNKQKEEIAATLTFSSSTQLNTTTQTLYFHYSNITSKAQYIGVFFQSGTDKDISKMSHINGDYNASPFKYDRIVGSVLKIDNVVLNYNL